MKKIFAFLFAFSAFSIGVSAEIVPEKIYLLANAADEESVALANFYCEKRGVPAENIIAFEMSKKETIERREYSAIRNRLLQNLIDRGLLKKVALSKELDPAGAALVEYQRDIGMEDAALGLKVDCLLVCRGVPLRVANDQALMPETADKDGKSLMQEALAVNCASVDSELALLAVPNLPLGGPSKNPFFKKTPEAEMQKMTVRVCRLDGPSFDAAKRIVTRSIEAERAGGPAGRAYVDKGGPYAEGNKWFDETAKILKDLGYDMTLENTGKLLGQTTRYDAPVFYFGWYARRASGFIEDPDFYFPAGTVAFHLHSFSATTLRDRKEWCASLIDRGAVATFGNVYEPFLSFSLHPHFVMESLAKGETLIEAAFAGTPVLSWQGIIVGDPLYRPFAEDIKEQLYLQQMRAKLHPSPLSQYIFMRTVNYARSRGDSRKAEIVGRELKLFTAGLAGKFFVAAEENEGKTLSVWTGPTLLDMRRENVGLLLETARWLAAHGRKAEAATIYGELLARPSDQIVSKYRKAVLEEAIAFVKENHLTGTRLGEWLEEVKKYKK
ncbi:MAG: TIGR03790 family protein [Opitutales bacterium]|nr:TIGR03790 family protein [Opitutales bacterium]